MTERKGEGLVRLMLNANEVTKLNWLAKALNKTHDETVEMIVRAHLVGVESEDCSEFLDKRHCGFCQTSYLFSEGHDCPVMGNGND